MIWDDYRDDSMDKDGCTPFRYVYYHGMKIVFNLGILGDYNYNP